MIGNVNKSIVHKPDSFISFNQYTDSYVLPHKSKLGTWGLGGVLDNKRNYIENSGFIGWTTFGGSYDFDKYSISDDEVIWFGNLINHWGHFIVDNLSRMWWILENESSEKKIVYVSESDSVHQNILRFFEILGIGLERLIRVTSVTRFKSIIIPDYSKTEDFYSDRFTSIFNKVIGSCDYAGISQPNKLMGKIYLSRQSFSSAKGRELGEDLVELLFSDCGYNIIYPENLSLDEQIFMWNNSDEIVCFNGTIPLNICFCRNKNLRLCVLNKTSRLHQNIYDFLSIFKLNHINIIDAYFKDSDRYVESLGGGPFIMKVTDDVTAYLGGHKGVDFNDCDLNKYKLNPMRRKVFLYKFLLVRTAKKIVKSFLKI